VKRSRHWAAEELSVMVQNILQHICGCHDSCNVTWCYDKKAAEENLPFNPPSEHRLDKLKYLETYNQVQEVFKHYASVDMMQYCNHPHDTQTNEVLNQAITNIALKSVC
jgi:hypothetical protein